MRGVRGQGERLALPRAVLRGLQGFLAPDCTARRGSRVHVQGGRRPRLPSHRRDQGQVPEMQVKDSKKHAYLDWFLLRISSKLSMVFVRLINEIAVRISLF